MTAETPIRVTVGVPTFRRPEDLRTLLPELLRQAGDLADSSGGRYAVDLLVVDNDPDRSAAAVVDELANPALRYAPEPHPGVAAARNRAMDASPDSRLLAMIDDDELPQPGWLAHLVTTWADERPAAVAGRVVARFLGDLTPWVAAGRFFERYSMPTGTPVSTAAAGNLLLDLDQVRAAAVRFPTELGAGGGEDNLFTRELVDAGGRIVWCNESVAVDLVPVERMTRRWVLTRSWSHGNASVLTDLRLTGSGPVRVVVRVRWAVRGFARLAAGGGRWGFGVLSRSLRHQARGLRTALRGAGMVGGAFGIVYLEYARPGERRLRVQHVPARARAHRLDGAG